jgi:3',5'-cyclic AMP phosphodiesterase CpdA
MPITLPPISRRRFLAGSAAAAVAAATSRWSFAEPAKPDPNRFVLISDTHIDANLAAVKRGVTMADNLRQALVSILTLNPPPAAMLHTGDITDIKGDPADYVNVIELLKPVRAAGLPIHLMLGNHDDRDNLWKAIPTGKPPLVEQRHISVIASPWADWYLLDTLDKPNVTPGVLGEAQLKWLAASLDANPNKPAIVMTHHHPLIGPPRKFNGLTDFQPLFDIVNPRKQVKLLVYGHTHDYGVFIETADRPHRINLPPVAYVFAPGKPSGWIDCTLADGGATFKLVTLDEKHAQNGETNSLKWR